MKLNLRTVKKKTDVRFLKIKYVQYFVNFLKSYPRQILSFIL